MARFLTQPKLLSAYISQDDLDIIRKLIPKKRIWKTKVLYGVKEIPAHWLARQPNKANIKPTSNVQPTSNGINRRGQLFLQKAIESYVYSVLGAQVQTRWPIVGQGAKSSQSQDIFHKLVQETIVQPNDSIMITNMREAIKGTNVALNLAVLPGVILVPSRLIILDKPIRGYNNQLTIAKKSMSFGTNDDVNYSPSSTIPNTTPEPTPTVTKKKPKPKNEERFHESSTITPKPKVTLEPQPVSKETTHKEMVEVAAAVCVGVGLCLFLLGKKFFRSK